MIKDIYLSFEIVFMILCCSFANCQSDSERANFEALPILSYDTDVGFGYGAKLFFFDQLSANESFDLILFNSTKGEKWYKLVFSTPDFESRQGKKYQLALDLAIEYDRFSDYTCYYYSNLFNGTNQSVITLEDKGKYEKINLGLFLSRALLTDFTIMLALQFKAFSFYNVTPDSRRTEYFHPKEISSDEEFLSSAVTVKWDTRTSYLNPKSGLVMTVEFELAPEFEFNSVSFIRYLLSYQYYKELSENEIVLALRGRAEAISHAYRKSIFSMINIGGNNTVRGIPMDKYRYEAVLLFNNELRFPIWWRFAGVVGVDLATGGSSEYEDNLNPGWLLSGVAGLRFLMDNFIVRADFGISEKSSGFYLNFNHLF